MQFYLGTHLPHWLALTDVPLFVSRRRLYRYRTLPRAIGKWALDSGGFTELSMHGSWQTTPHQYAQEARRYMTEVGGMEWAAIQDWMCEPWILKQTGLTVTEHQQRTIESYLTLMDLAPDVPWTPVVQGWRPEDYLRHVEQYALAGVDLTRSAVVGLGTVCRRQGTRDAVEIVSSLYPIRLHGFGVKLTGLRLTAPLLHSADSMAWSYDARHNPPLPGHTHKNCANCYHYAQHWHQKVLNSLANPPAAQLRFPTTVPQR